MSDKKVKITTVAGVPYINDQKSLEAGKKGPLLLKDFTLIEKLSHFSRERIPERVVHAKGTGAYGTFKVTNDITKYTHAKVFDTIGKTTRVFARFSTASGEKGSADTERDPRGFAVKFYTEDGNWDLVGNNTPIFFVNDAKKFPDFIHTQKINPITNCKDSTMMWDYWSFNPESIHQVLFLMSDRGTPVGYRHMNGYGSHTFSMINAQGEKTWVKFHFKTKQGIKNFTAEEAATYKQKDPDFSQRDLVEAIENKQFPAWQLKIQVMTKQQAKHLSFNPFDVTKVWSHKDFPLIDVGTLELNEVPNNYFAHVEQSAFSPASVVPGISYSPDKMLQGRLFSYADAHRYRLGVNYEQLKVNKCPFMVHNYQRDGFMAINNGEDKPNYYPNSFDDVDITPQGKYVEPTDTLEDAIGDWNDKPDDHYSQPHIFFNKILSAEDKRKLINNIATSMNDIKTSKRDIIIQRQLCHFFRVDKTLGLEIAQKLGVDISKLPNM